MYTFSHAFIRTTKEMDRHGPRSRDVYSHDGFYGDHAAWAEAHAPFQYLATRIFVSRFDLFFFSGALWFFRLIYL